MRRPSGLLSAVLLAGCAAPPEWRSDFDEVLSEARQGGQELAVFFALPGRAASEFMMSRLSDPIVMDALAAGGFAAAIADGVKQKRLYGAWVGGGEGMGMAVVDGKGYCYAARPGPQDPEQVAAFLAMCASQRVTLAKLRDKLQQADAGPTDQHALGCLLLDLGCRVHAEPLLLQAAALGVTDATHRLARLYALDGNLTAARQWLKASPRIPAAMLTEGYVRYKERRHQEAIKAFEAALATGQLGADRQHALLYLGKSLHESKRDELAIPILEALVAENTGSTFEAAATHTLGHIYNPSHGHGH